MYTLIVQFDLSLSTLLFTLLIPFCFFGVLGRYGMRTDVIKHYEAFLASIAVIIGLLCIIQLGASIGTQSSDYRLLRVLHIGVVFISILMMRKISSLMTPSWGNYSQPAQSSPSFQTPMQVPIMPLSVDGSLSLNDLVLPEVIKKELFGLVDGLRVIASGRPNPLAPKATLIQGPVGTGKTTIGKLLAHSAGLHLYRITPHDFLIKNSTSQESLLDRIIEAARQSQPSILLVDEIDLIGRSRSSAPIPVADSALEQLLRLLDLVEGTPGLFLIATTSEVGRIDEAVLRPGRLTQKLVIPLPSLEERAAIIRLYLMRCNAHIPKGLSRVAEESEGLSPAAIKAICFSAARHSNNEISATGQIWITESLLLAAIGEFRSAHGEQAHFPVPEASNQ